MRAEKGFTLFILNKGMNHIIKIMKLLQDLLLLIDVVTETVKGKIKKKQEGLLSPLAAWTVHPVISSVVKFIIGKGVRRTGREYMDKDF